MSVLNSDIRTLGMIYYGPAYFVIAPVQTMVTAYLLYTHVGLKATAAGLTALFAFIPLQGKMLSVSNNYQVKQQNDKDKRSKLMSEILNAIKVIKLNCWQKPFAKLISAVRADELASVRMQMIVRSLNSACSRNATTIMAFVTFITYVLCDGRLSTETLFVTMALFRQLAVPLTEYLPFAISNFVGCRLGTSRIQDVLNYDEKPQVDANQSEQSSKGCLVFNGYSATWSKDEEKNVLDDVNLEVADRELVMVVGSVGSGKTALLNGILNEIITNSGSLSVGGTLSFSPQESWCFSATVRENILLTTEHDEDFDRERYDQVIQACGLKPDLDGFPDGDRTLVGEKGYTLSGGQKARIALARAVYRRADIYLLDDPLSAVDVAVASHIFNTCIRGLLKNSTVILVTHQTQFLANADKVVLVENGSVRIGTSDDFKHINFERQPSKPDDNATLSRSTSIVDEEVTTSKADQTDLLSNSELGMVSSIMTFFRLANSRMAIVTSMVVIISAQFLRHRTDLWIANWSKESHENESHSSFVINYSLFIMVTFVFSYGQGVSFFILGLRSARKLHDQAFSSLLDAPVTFFERTPIATTTNVFTHHSEQVDVNLPFGVSFVVNVNHRILAQV